MAIELDRETHTYSNGLPSVTDILRSAGLIDASWFTPQAWMRGRAVHLACEYYDQGDLDEETIDPEIAGYLEAYKRYRACAGQAGNNEWIEIPRQDKMGTFAGTPDRVIAARPKGIIDIKTGAPQPWHRIQLAAYVSMMDDPFGYSRLGLYLRPDGSYKVREYPKSEYISDLSIFQAALTIHYWRQRNGSTI
jgi:hypothetical protein